MDLLLLARPHVVRPQQLVKSSGTTRWYRVRRATSLQHPAKVKRKEIKWVPSRESRRNVFPAAEGDKFVAVPLVHLSTQSLAHLAASGIPISIRRKVGDMLVLPSYTPSRLSESKQTAAASPNPVDGSRQSAPNDENNAPDNLTGDCKDSSQPNDRPIRNTAVGDGNTAPGSSTRQSEKSSKYMQYSINSAPPIMGKRVSEKSTSYNLNSPKPTLRIIGRATASLDSTPPQKQGHNYTLEPLTFTMEIQGDSGTQASRSQSYTTPLAQLAMKFEVTCSMEYGTSNHSGAQNTCYNPVVRNQYPHESADDAGTQDFTVEASAQEGREATGDIVGTQDITTEAAAEERGPDETRTTVKAQSPKILKAPARELEQSRVLIRIRTGKKLHDSIAPFLQKICAPIDVANDWTIKKKPKVTRLQRAGEVLRGYAARIRQYDLLTGSSRSSGLEPVEPFSVEGKSLPPDVSLAYFAELCELYRTASMFSSTWGTKLPLSQRKGLRLQHRRIEDAKVAAKSKLRKGRSRKVKA